MIGLGWLAGLKAKLMIGVGALGAALLWIWRIKAGAHRRGREEVIRESHERAIEHVEIKNRVEDRIGGADGDELDELRRRWTRNPK